MSGLRFVDVGVSRGGRPVLNAVSVGFGASRLTAVIGPNGAGKSTLLETAAGLLSPIRGIVTLDGIDLTTMSRRTLAQRRAYLPQRAGVEWPITVERAVALGLTPSLPAFGGLPSALQHVLDQTLDSYNLQSVRGRPATTLSGGELARVMLARATVGDPALLIVDEPTAGLDPRHAIDAVARLRARARDGRSVIMAVHEIDLALRFADDIVAIKDGRVHWDGAAASLTQDDLERLYEIEARLVRDESGVSVHFGG